MSAKIRYAIEGNGPPVTLVHGVGASLESWDEVAEHMKVHFTLLRMNLRGHGSLTKPISQNFWQNKAFSTQNSKIDLKSW